MQGAQIGAGAEPPGPLTLTTACTQQKKQSLLQQTCKSSIVCCWPTARFCHFLPNTFHVRLSPAVLSIKSFVTRDLRSFEIRFEFESDVPIRIRFESDVPNRNFRIGMPCAVIPQTTPTHCSTKKYQPLRRL